MAVFGWGETTVATKQQRARTSFRRAVAATWRGDYKLSSTILSFSSSDRHDVGVQWGVSVKHVRLGPGDMLEKRLKVQPTDELVSNMFAAVASTFRRHHGRLGARRLDRELSLAALL